MQKEFALRILNALANGIHPATGEKFGADSPYQHPDTVRALFEAMRAVEGMPALQPKGINAARIESALADIENAVEQAREEIRT